MSTSDEARTRVYWNIDDVPIPEGVDLHKYSDYMKSDIESKGYDGEVSIWAYCEKKSCDALLSCFRHSEIVVREKVSGVEFAEVDNMAVDILVCSLFDREAPVNLIVFSESISQGTELFDVLQVLYSEKSYDVFVGGLHGSFSLLFGEGNARNAGNAVQSRSSREAKTGVFWNIEDCPIPQGLDPDEIYKNVKSSLANQGCHGQLSIWAYCEKNDLSLAGVTMVPAGDQPSRLKKMLWDILFWALRNPVYYGERVPNLMVISRSTGFVDNVIHSLNSRGYSVLLALPDMVEYVSSFWLYPSLRGSANPIIDQSQSSHLVLNKEKKKRTRSEGRRLTLKSQLRFSNSMLLSHVLANKRKKIQKQSKSERKRLGKKATKANKEAKTDVFWNIDRCPFPSRFGLDMEADHIKSDLVKQGYHGDVSIRAYVEERLGFCYWFWRCGDDIPVQNRVSEGEDLCVKLDKMFVDILLWALDNPAPANLMVISKNISEERELLSLVQALERKGYNILLPQSNETILSNERNKIQRKSSPERHEANTFLFWNIEDCPIPGGLDPLTFLQNIKTALANFGRHGHVSITAYRDKNTSLENLSFTDNITITSVSTEGDRFARTKKMVEDILFWALENPKPSTFMVITDGYPDNVCDALDALGSRGYSFLSADPTAVIYAEYVWLSDKLLGGGGPISPTH